MSLYKKYIFAAAATMLLVPGFFSWVLFKINSEQIYSADIQRVELASEIILKGDL